MQIRPVEAGDIPRIEEMFAAQTFEYSKPDWGKMTGQVLVDDDGVVRIALLNRPTTENYAVVDRSAWAPPGIKAVNFERLDQSNIRQLRAQGYTDQHSWVPPVCRAFLRRLTRFFGWIEADGPEHWTGLVRHI